MSDNAWGSENPNGQANPGFPARYVVPIDYHGHTTNVHKHPLMLTDKDIMNLTDKILLGWYIGLIMGWAIDAKRAPTDEEKVMLEKLFKQKSDLTAVIEEQNHKNSMTLH